MKKRRKEGLGGRKKGRNDRPTMLGLGERKVERRV
jgi:hypothetical protein